MVKDRKKKLDGFPAYELKGVSEHFLKYQASAEYL